MIIAYLKRLGMTRAFSGARTGDIWLLTTGLLIWRWAVDRGGKRR